MIKQNKCAMNELRNYVIYLSGISVFDIKDFQTSRLLDIMNHFFFSFFFFFFFFCSAKAALTNRFYPFWRIFVLLLFYPFKETLWPTIFLLMPLCIQFVFFFSFFFFFFVLLDIYFLFYFSPSNVE